MTIRPAEQKDAQDLREIYNYEVTHGTATFDVQEKTLEDRQRWIAVHNVDNHPLLVAEIDGRAAAYASLSSFRDWEAYASTVELSVYVHPAYRRRGLARALMDALLTMAREDPRTHVVVSVITGGNEASLALHRAFGFTHSGTLHEVGQKYGRYLDVEYLELRV